MSHIDDKSQLGAGLTARPQIGKKIDMQKSPTFKNALSFWLKKRNLSQTALAEKLGVNKNTISQYCIGARFPSLENLEKLAAILGLSVSEFFSCKENFEMEIALIEKVTARPRAGVGGLETDAEHSGLYPFRRSFIDRIRGQAEHLKIFEVAGDSMEPTLADGDLIMVNLQEKNIRTGYIYLLRIGIGDDAELMVKRLERRPGNILLIRSDNGHYSDISVSLSDVDGEIEIFGRMVWSCREY